MDASRTAARSGRGAPRGARWSKRWTTSLAPRKPRSDGVEGNAHPLDSPLATRKTQVGGSARSDRTSCRSSRSRSPPGTPPGAARLWQDTLSLGPRAGILWLSNLGVLHRSLPTSRFSQHSSRRTACRSLSSAGARFSRSGGTIWSPHPGGPGYVGNKANRLGPAAVDLGPSAALRRGTNGTRPNPMRG